MSGPELTQSLESIEYVAFKLVQAMLFLGGLWQLLNWHFHISEKIGRWIRLAAAQDVPRKPSIPSRGT